MMIELSCAKMMVEHDAKCPGTGSTKVQALSRDWLTLYDQHEADQRRNAQLREDIRNIESVRDADLARIADLERRLAERGQREKVCADAADELRVLSRKWGPPITAKLLSDFADRLAPKPEPHPWLAALRQMKDEAIVAGNFERAAALRDAVDVVEPPKPEPKRCRVSVVQKPGEWQWQIHFCGAKIGDSREGLIDPWGNAESESQARSDALAVAKARGLEVVE